MTGSTLRVALAQTASTTDVSANLHRMRAACGTAAERGARLTVFPEFAMAKHADLTVEALAQAEAVDGGFAQDVSRMAREHGQTVVAGMLERDGEDVFNTLVAFDASGDLVATYRKVHLYDAYGQRESDRLRAGDPASVATIDLGDVRVGLLTCYDLRFPESARLHADAGVELLLYPANWVPGENKRLHWTTLARARAIENTLYVAAVSQAPPTGIGTSVLFDPAGLEVVSLGDEPGVVVADVSSRRVETVREVNPSLDNRRFDVVARTV
ncbi:MAG TPA: carbon-nitrogen hydrolase family protein [Candidatus Stackebrandtia excrementipullorum]|nr:carbon-nitrogen hydrolase family protein [Candidatus Stackebrandtia excrementipullorum]